MVTIAITHETIRLGLIILPASNTPLFQMADVWIKKAAYADSAFKAAVFELMTALDRGRIVPRSRVLIKPNLLMPAAPDTAISTHPLLVAAVVEYVNQKGVQPLIADSPPVGAFHKFMKKGGYREALSGLDFEMRPFREATQIDVGEPFGSIELATDAAEADVIVNLAKLKTHSLMLLTLAVKNMFGCVIGLEKPKWHLRAGTDRSVFARLLVQIEAALRPAVNIVDGVLALEGQGPGKSGIPRELNLLVGSQDTVAADMAICKLLGVDADVLPTHRAAVELNRLPDRLYIRGDCHMVNDFRLPELDAATFGSGRLQRFMRNRLIQRPVSNNRECKLCGECWRYCPAKAIGHTIKGVRFDYNACIRCYCCLEICPYGAVRAKKPLFGGLWDRFNAIRSG